MKNMMHPALLALSMLALLAPLAPAQGEEPEILTVTAKPLAVGEVLRRGLKSDSTVKQVVSMGGEELQAEEFESSVSSKSVWTVLARDEAGVSKVKLHVSERVVRDTRQGLDGEPKESELTGKTFIIERTDSGLKFTDGEGEPISDQVREELESGVRRKGSIISGCGGMEKLLARSKFTVGAPITLEGEDVATFMGSRNPVFPTTRMTFTAVGKRVVFGSECVVFKLTGRMGREEDGEQPGPVAVVKGETVVRSSDGRMLSLKIEGPLTLRQTVDQGEQVLDVALDGKLAIALLCFFTKNEKKKAG